MQTDNYIYKRTFAPEGTQTIIAAKHRVFAPQVGTGGLTLVGNLSQFNLNESRTVEPVRGIGKGMQIAELVPGVVEPMSISCQFFALYLANVMQIFGFNSGVDGFVRSLKEHQWPFDIKSEIVMSRLSKDSPAASGNTNALGTGTQRATTDGMFQNLSGYDERAIITIYEACWMESHTMETDQGNAIVTSGVELKSTDVIDGRYSGLLGASTGNEPNSDTGGSNRTSVGYNLLGIAGQLTGLF